MKKILILLLFLAVNLQYGQGKRDVQETKEKIEELLQKARESKSILAYNEALNHCNEALDLSVEIQDKENEAKISRVIGELFMLNNNLDDAIDYLNKASIIQNSNEFHEELAKTRNTMGLVYIKKNNYTQALNYFDGALTLYRKLNLFSSQTEVLKNKGILYLSKEEYQTAYETFEEALDASKKYALEPTKAEILLHNSKALFALNRINEAITDCEDAIDIGLSNKYTNIVVEGYKTLSEIYEASNDISKAYEELAKYSKFKDSIFNLRSDKLAEEAKARFNFADKERQIEQQDLLIQQKEEQLKQSRILTILGLAFLVLFLLFILFLYRNIQKRRKANELLRDTNKQLIVAKETAEKATKTKAQFLSTVTHELRTPLYAVTGLTDLLLDQNPTKEQEGHLKSLRFSGDYLLNFINDILDVNKIEANKIEIEKIPFNLKKLTKNVLFTLNKSAEDNNTTLHLNFEETIPTNFIGDSLRISQVLINLVSNAIKFTKNGNIYLNIKSINQGVNNVKLLFEVKDTGIGISYDKQEIIFESFSQGSVQINRKYGGTGLGLTIVKNLLELMDSKIQLKSEPGVGTNFFFEIVLDVASDDFDEEKKTNNILPENYLEALKNKNVLLVEDVKINQLITKKTLAKKEIKCIAVDNGTDAISKAKEFDFDLILMDIHMPGISGIEATTAIRSFDKKIPIIALTAITIEEEQQEDFNNAGFNDILSKPFKTDIFFEKIYLQIKK